ALLAPAVVLLVRSARDLLAVLWSLVLWSSAATIVGIAEFFGAHVAATGTVGRRQASFLSSADFAALSVAALLAGVGAVARRRLRLRGALGVAAFATGVLGTIVAGSVASVLGLATAVVVLALLLLVRHELVVRRAAAVAAAAAVVLAGVVAIRSSDLD